MTRKKENITPPPTGVAKSRMRLKNSMPNGKGSTEWGFWPSPEELIVAAICFILTLIATRSWTTSFVAGIIGGILMLWANNGWPGPWNNFGKRRDG